MTDKRTTQPYHYITALSIAGLDPSGGAGLLADVKTFSALGVYGMAVATALTVQNTLGVKAVEAVPPDVVYAQVETVMSDIQPQAVKVGMTNDAETIRAIAWALRRNRPQWLVIDPIMLSSSGATLMQDEALGFFKQELMPLATLLTPNLPETCKLAGRPFNDDIGDDEMAEIAQIIMGMGPSAVLIKGGHHSGSAKRDVLFQSLDGTLRQEAFSSETILTSNTHGTGCTLSAAITAHLACGLSLSEAVGKAKQYMAEALRTGSDVQAGHGHGSVNHFFNPKKMIKKSL